MKRLRELRKEKNLAQWQLAGDLNVAQNTISRYETGQREASYSQLVQFAKYFDVSVDYLLGVTNERKG